MREAELTDQEAAGRIPDSIKNPIKYAPVHDYSLVEENTEEEEPIIFKAAESKALSSLTEEQKITFFQNV